MAQTVAYHPRRVISGLAVLIAVYLIVVYGVPKPETVKPEGWRLTGVFLATVAGCVLQPIPGGALVLMAVALSALIGGLTLEKALGGYGDPSVWLVMAAFFISRALINTGLARRIALFFVGLFGRSSLGVSYSLALSDLVLATSIPSNGARSGGVVLPIVRSVAELYESSPGATANRLGSYLMSSVYQSICITTAMFYTGQASNSLAANIATTQFGISVTPLSWFVAMSVPGLIALLVVPWVVLQLNPPEIVKTPEAREFAHKRLVEMGPFKRGEWILSVTFLVICALWIRFPRTDQVTITALLGAMFLLMTGVLHWDDVKGEREAWDLFIWYGGLVEMGRALNDYGVTKAFAQTVAQAFSGVGWVGLFAICAVIYFYAHYGFASITAHILSMLAPFVGILVAKGAPPGPVIFTFLAFSNLSAGLTNYGTTPCPMFFSQGYVPMAKWWQIGFVVSLVNFAVWIPAGWLWWKVLGYW